MAVAYDVEHPKRKGNKSELLTLLWRMNDPEIESRQLVATRPPYLPEVLR
jgi:hypothetical protein